MADKRITIDDEAYERLQSARQSDESLSETIRRVVRPPFDVEAWLRRARSTKLSPKALEAIERQVRSRRRRSRRER